MIDSKTENKLAYITIKKLRPRFGGNHDENTARSKLALEIRVSKLKNGNKRSKAYVHSNYEDYATLRGQRFWHVRHLYDQGNYRF